jgi:O-antigen/teichoic acid export membrane protein
MMGLRGMAGRINAYLAERHFVRNTALLAGSTAVAQAANVLAAPVLTRLYSPRDLGLFGVFFAFTSVAAVVACARYDVAVVSARTRNEAAVLTALALGLAVPITAVCTLTFLFLQRTKAFGFGEFSSLTVVFAAVAVFVTAAYGALRYWFMREEEFRFIAKFSAAQGIARPLGQIALAFAFPSAVGLIAGDVAGRFVGVFTSFRGAARILREELARAGSGAWRAVARQYREFPQYSLPSTFLDTFALHAPVPMVAFFYSAARAGELTLAQRVLAVPVAFISLGVADAFHGRAAAYLRDSPDQIRPFFLRTARTLFLAGCIPILVVVLVAAPAFELIFGRAWREAGTLAAILAPLALMQMTVSPVSRILMLIPRGPRVKLLYDLMGLLSVVTIAVAHAGGLPAFGAIATYVVTQSLAFGLYFALMLRMVSRIGKSAD